MQTDDDPAFVVAVFPDGSVLRRYTKSREYWHEKPEGLMYPAEHLSMRRAVDRAVWREATIVPDAPGAQMFYRSVERAMVDWRAQRRLD